MELNISYLYSFLSKRGYSPHFIDKEIIQFRIENFTYLIDCETDYFRIMMVNTNPIWPYKHLVDASSSIMDNRKLIKVFVMKHDDGDAWMVFSIEQLISGVSHFEAIFDRCIRIIRGAWADWAHFHNTHIIL